MLSQLPVLDRISALALPVLLLFLGYMLVFFVLLPFAARPGLNKACIRHTLRTTLLGTGILHLMFLALAGVLLLVAFFSHGANNSDVLIRCVLLTVLPLVIWAIIALVRCARKDYRSASEMPQPHDPWCDQGGYSLSGVAGATRCRECGKPIMESVGPENRSPTAWENHPRPGAAGDCFQADQDVGAAAAGIVFFDADADRAAGGATVVDLFGAGHWGARVSDHAGDSFLFFFL